MDILVHICIVILLCKTGLCTLIYRYNTTPSTWQEAKRTCEYQGGALVIESIENSLVNCTDFPQNTSFWLGTYDTFSPWIQTTGCTIMDISMITTVHIDIDNAVSCADKCDNYFGMMNTSCYCLPDDRNITEYGFVDDIFCDKRCIGNKQDSCGGSNHVTIYRKVGNSEVIDRADEKDKNNIACGVVECTNNQWTYFGYSCNRSNPAYCNDKNRTSSNIQWDDGKETCWTVYNSFLIGHRISDMACTNETDKAPVWVGLYRRKIIKTIKDTESDVFKCFNGIFINGIIETSESSCTTQLPFVCELDTDLIQTDDCNLNPEITTTESISSTTTDADYSTSTEETVKSTTVRTLQSTAAIGSSDSENSIETGLGVGLGLALAIPVLFAALTVVCHCLYGKPPITERKEDDVVNIRNKEDYYIRPSSEDMSEINPRYSLFEYDEEELKEQNFEVGRVSTFVVNQNENNLGNGVLINPDDVITKL